MNLETIIAGYEPIPLETMSANNLMILQIQYTELAARFNQLAILTAMCINAQTNRSDGRIKEATQCEKEAESFYQLLPDFMKW